MDMHLDQNHTPDPTSAWTRAGTRTLIQPYPCPDACSDMIYARTRIWT